MKNSISMTQFAATVAGCIGVPAPEEAGEPFTLAGELMRAKDVRKAEKVLIYNPDAVGLWLFQKYTEWFAPVLRHTQLGVPVCTVLPSYTPVCFGTMYTGVEPSVHGIQKYEKHVLEQKSLFDTLAEAGKKVAIVAVENSSMAIIFGNRQVDYYILPYDGEVRDKALELIEEDKYDVIAVYNQEYDDVMHRTWPESEESLQALKNHIRTFDQLCCACEKKWKEQDSLLCWATDHGIHTNQEGHGTHGSDLEEDLNVMHFFGVQKGRKENE